MKKEVCYTKTDKKKRIMGETGMKYANPYTPGAGFMPGHIAGRKESLERAEKYLNTIVLGYPQQSMIYYGLRGVGKTVLLNAIDILKLLKRRILHSRLRIILRNLFIK